MVNSLKPQVDQWYVHLDKGQRFYITAINDDDGTIDVQHFDGDLDEFTLDDWYRLDIEVSVQPENWVGAMDITEKDDLGTDIPDTRGSDWTEPQQDFRPLND